ncbi:hypothetical protein OKW34_000822 [Paraburkholderia youngii]|uniref:Uncharacterized protein n=1 Tax=Paraburkholderia youngii TaxID=2782701 RepID=A0A7W8L7G3_9BURK|nr:hypothetical protein [Paraburkholderia youngii]
MFVNWNESNCAAQSARSSHLPRPDMDSVCVVALNDPVCHFFQLDGSILCA